MLQYRDRSRVETEIRSRSSRRVSHSLARPNACVRGHEARRSLLRSEGWRFDVSRSRDLGSLSRSPSLIDLKTNANRTILNPILDPDLNRNTADPTLNPILAALSLISSGPSSTDKQTLVWVRTTPMDSSDGLRGPIRKRHSVSVSSLTSNSSRCRHVGVSQPSSWAVIVTSSPRLADLPSTKSTALRLVPILRVLRGVVYIHTYCYLVFHHSLTLSFHA